MTERDYPRIIVPPPGPKARAIVARDAEWTSTCYIKEYPLVVARGQGVMVEDVDGNRFLDFMAGIAVSSTGYGHPRVVAAVKDAADRFLHICGSDFYYEGMAALCERLAKVAPGASKKRVFLTNSGTEAVEAAIKLARYATRRTAIIAFRGAFHGRTTGAVTLTSSKARQHAGFGPLLPDVHHVPFAYRYRCQFCSDEPGCNRGCIDVLEKELFTRHLDPAGCCRHLLRADPGRRRLHRSAGGLPAGATGAVRSSRYPAGRGRSPVGRRAYRADVRLRARGNRAGHSPHRQGPRLRHADRSDDLQGIDHDLGEWLPRLDVRRKPGLLCRGAGDAGPGRRWADGQRRPHG